MVEIKKSGKGAVEHHQMISESDLRKLYNSIFMSAETPTGLLNRVQMNIRLFFCRRANENMEKMEKDTFKIMSYEDGSLYVTKSTDELTKNHRQNDTELVSGHMPEDKENPSSCPVHTFQLYLSKLNPQCKRLWQYPRETFSISDDIWYQNRPIGRDTLAKFMQRLSEKVPLSQHYTNHCIRVTGTSILSQNNFQAAQIMSVTGHKSVSSLSVYQKVTDQEKQAMGNTLRESIMPSSLVQKALPAPTGRFALPAPPTNTLVPFPAPQYVARAPFQQESALVKNHVSHHLDGVNLDDLWSDFDEAGVTERTGSASNKVLSVTMQAPRAPVFEGCTMSNVTININYKC